MPKWAWIVLCVGALVGCSAVGDRPVVPIASGNKDMFAAVSMRIHPIFTQVKDWNGDGHPDGIEAELEFLDRFGDPTKAQGKVIFELFDYLKVSADPRGRRMANPYIATINTLDEQETRWNRTSRTYSFQLAFPTVRRDKNYVLTATFEPTVGKRMFSRLIVKAETPNLPTTGPVGF
jgi:hypothetical protein